MSRERSRHYLMCPPTYFAVRYRINPWMHPEEPVDLARANAQWQAVHDALVRLGHRVELARPDPGLPDMVFTANAGIVIGERGLVSRFAYPERGPETEQFGQAMSDVGVAKVHQARIVNEGEGDFLLTGGRLLAGYGMRTQLAAMDEVSEYFGVPVQPLRLVDERFYHLDTALARLDEETVAYWPGAFAPEAAAKLRDLFPDAILATEAEADTLALNMVSDGSSVIMTTECDRLADQIAERGYELLRRDTDELRKAGGGAKCCVLELHPAPSPAG